MASHDGSASFRKLPVVIVTRRDRGPRRVRAIAIMSGSASMPQTRAPGADSRQARASAPVPIPRSTTTRIGRAA
jgi:hypothetical protein